jgi:hypothetical protein
VSTPFPFDANFEKQLFALIVRDPTFLSEHPQIRAEMFGHSYCRMSMERVEQHVEKYGSAPTPVSFKEIIRGELARTQAKKGEGKGQELIDSIKAFCEEILAHDLRDRAFIADKVQQWIEHQSLRRLIETGAKAIDEARRTGVLDHEPMVKLWREHFDGGGATPGRSRLNFIKPDQIVVSDPRWIWDGIIEAGMVSILSAYAKTGKSELAYGLALAVSRGEKYLGRATMQGPALILAVEEHEKLIKRRLLMSGWKESDPIYLHVGRAGNPAAAIRELQKVIEGMSPKPVFVLLDTLTRFWDIENEADPRETSPHLTMWTELARATDAHVMLAHHDNKAGGEFGRQIRGSSDILSAVDYGLMLNRHRGAGEDDPRRMLVALGRYEITPPKMYLTFHHDTGYRMADDQTAPPVFAKSDPKYDLLLQLIPDFEQLTYEEIERLIDVEHKVARRLIAKAINEGAFIEGEKRPSGPNGGPPMKTFRRKLWPTGEGRNLDEKGVTAQPKTRGNVGRKS